MFFGGRENAIRFYQNASSLKKKEWGKKMRTSDLVPWGMNWHEQVR
jgi:hypothetical protein